jgi:mannose-1-phosphate guanylyltransferase
MKAVLLVAGLGTRLRPLTEITPKCLLPIGGKPLLQIWLDKLVASGVQEVLINTHWLSGEVELYIAQIEKSINIAITPFYEPVLLGSAGTLAANRDWLSISRDPFYIIYGDNLCWVDLTEMNHYHCHHEFSFTLGVFRTTHPEKCGIVETDRNDVVISFEEKPAEPKTDIAAAGIYMADRRIFDVFPTPSAKKSDVLDLGFDILPRLIGQMKCFNVGECIDIGTHASYQKAKQRWQHYNE